jgi:hypothetical protein
MAGAGVGSHPSIRLKSWKTLHLMPALVCCLRVGVGFSEVYARLWHRHRGARYISKVAELHAAISGKL